VNVRVISATNVDIAGEVAAGRFREDLLYRLNTIEVKLPPLRDRREDIPLLARHFLEALARRYRIATPTLDVGAAAALLEHAWPGNVRELEHALERALLMAQDGSIQADDLALKRASPAPGRFEDMTLEAAEKHLIQRAIARSSGNVTEAARSLGLSRSALYRRLQHFGLKGME
jgi:DNA-binding NtrC family response regulator